MTFVFRRPIKNLLSMNEPCKHIKPIKSLLTLKLVRMLSLYGGLFSLLTDFCIKDPYLAYKRPMKVRLSMKVIICLRNVLEKFFYI